jgi:acyl-CoA thioester hydrolase
MRKADMISDRWHSTDIRVRYKDTDRMGVVYYGNYLTYFEIGRAEYMRYLGFPYSEMEYKGYNLVVVEASAKYHSNVGYDSLLTIKTAITSLTRVKIRFNYELITQADEPVVSGHTLHACINSDKRPSRIPESMANAIKGYLSS